MKVIIIKKCKDGNVNDVIEVSSGYGTNYLIKNGFAEPFNNLTSKKLTQRLENDKEIYQSKVQEALILKEKIEKLCLEFCLKTTNHVIHGSITNKKINLKLKELGFNLDKHSIEHIQIESLGLTKVKVKLFDQVEGTLKVMVNKCE